MHYGNKHGAPSQRPADIFRIDASQAINSQVRHRRTKPFEEATGIYHCRMFHLGGNDVSIRSSTCEEQPFESVIVSFTSATREYDLIGFTAEQSSNLHSSFVHRLPRRAASPVAARRITVWLLKDHPHRINDFRRGGSTGIKIQVNMSIRSRHGSYTLSARSVRNPAAVNPVRQHGFCWPQDPCGKTDGRIVHASRSRVKVRWFFLLSIAEIIHLADRRAIPRSPSWRLDSSCDARQVLGCRQP